MEKLKFNYRYKFNGYRPETGLIPIEKINSFEAKVFKHYAKYIDRINECGGYFDVVISDDGNSFYETLKNISVDLADDIHGG